MTEDDFERLIDKAAEHTAQRVGWLAPNFVAEALSTLNQLIKECNHAHCSHQTSVDHRDLHV